MLAAVAFLDAFQKVADMATNTRGGEGARLRRGELVPRVLHPEGMGWLQWIEPLGSDE